MAETIRSAALFRRVIEPHGGSFPPDVARYFLGLDFPPEDHSRFAHLSANAQVGKLSAAEIEELDAFLHVDSLLAVMRLEAERSR
ncbi:MAG TPA: hypothetical protein VG269_11705 [Tepidisphaeraceae bacterium]|jgi:hypothetical protein|nr:hypothetical protein [Tepidisphaeraceae bacterium]